MGDKILDDINQEIKNIEKRYSGVDFFVVYGTKKATGGNFKGSAFRISEMLANAAVHNSSLLRIFKVCVEVVSEVQKSTNNKE